MIHTKKGGYHPAINHIMTFLTGFIAALFELFFDHSKSNFSIYKIFYHFDECGARCEYGAYYSASLFNRHANLRSVCAFGLSQCFQRWLGQFIWPQNMAFIRRTTARKCVKHYYKCAFVLGRGVL